jgi:hypothetical protein
MFLLSLSVIDGPEPASLVEEYYKSFLPPSPALSGSFLLQPHSSSQAGAKKSQEKHLSCPHKSSNNSIVY